MDPTSSKWRVPMDQLSPESGLLWGGLLSDFGDGPDLRGAGLFKADLSHATLQRSSFVGARLSYAKMVDARLAYSNFTNADLAEADLTKADLSGATLERAFLWRAKLDSTQLRWANLRRASIAYPQGEPFGIENWMGADLSGLRILSEPNTLAGFERLRDEFRTHGMRIEERAITAALQRALDTGKGRWEGAWRFVAFDLTTDYGASPWRAVVLLFGGIVLFAFPYGIALRVKNPKRRGAIWMVWHDDRLLDRPPLDGPGKESNRERLTGLSILNAVRYGLQFSLLSAFHFGWRDLNVGTWLARMQPREYALRSSGWVRFVSGFQSLISVALLALALWTYFGRPFQ